MVLAGSMCVQCLFNGKVTGLQNQAPPDSYLCSSQTDKPKIKRTRFWELPVRLLRFDIREEKGEPHRQRTAASVSYTHLDVYKRQLLR